jgi:hypothetical protein
MTARTLLSSANDDFAMEAELFTVVDVSDPTTSRTYLRSGPTPQSSLEPEAVSEARLPYDDILFIHIYGPFFILLTVHRLRVKKNEQSSLITFISNAWSCCSCCKLSMAVSHHWGVLVLDLELFGEIERL